MFEAAYATDYSYTDVRESIGETYDDVSLTTVFEVDPWDTNLYEDASDEMIDNMETKEILYHHHSYGVKTSTYNKYSSLSSAFTIVQTYPALIDGATVDIVTAVEHKNYPIVGTQYHPEKNPFIYYPYITVPHSEEAIDMT